MEGVTLVDIKVSFGYDMASAEREHITGVWHSPQRNPGAEPWSGGQGAKPPEAGAFLGPGRPKEIANLLSFVLWELISLITAWCQQLNWRRQSFLLEGNYMFNCRSAFSWFSSILNCDNDNLKFVKKITVRSVGSLNPLTPPLRTPLLYLGTVGCEYELTSVRVDVVRLNWLPWPTRMSRRLYTPQRSLHRKTLRARYTWRSFLDTDGMGRDETSGWAAMSNDINVLDVNRNNWQANHAQLFDFVEKTKFRSTLLPKPATMS